MTSPFPRSHIVTERPRDLTLLRSLFALTEGLTGRGYRSAVRYVEPILAGKMARVVFEDGSEFHFPLSDPYWSRLVSPAFSYEPEIAWVLRRLQDVDYTFIDAGANFGFWSVLASAPAFGSKRALAIEASAETFAVLTRNREANAGRFEIFRNAIFDKDDVELGFSAGHHTTRQLTEGTAPETVRTITLDTLCAKAAVDLTRPVVLKLDVEGAELAALGGAARLLYGDTLLIYEEHGGDPGHASTQGIWSLGDWAVAFVDDDGGLHQVRTAEQISGIKVKPYKGYNFLACSRSSTVAKSMVEWR